MTPIPFHPSPFCSVLFKHGGIETYLNAIDHAVKFGQVFAGIPHVAALGRDGEWLGGDHRKGGEAAQLGSGEAGETSPGRRPPGSW